MSHEAKIHQAQTDILRELLFQPHARFADLQRVVGLESDHVKFHVKRLVDIAYIRKSNSGEYSLTTLGKEYANRLDTDQNTVERQPKSAVIIVLTADDGRLLIQKRLKHPYYGFYGYPGGKIRWGETIMQAATRELMEETGLAAELTYRGVYHEHVRSAESDDLLEDKIFHIIYGKNPSGELMPEFEGGQNSWITLDMLAKTTKKYVSTDTETSIGLGRESFIEKTVIYTQDEF